MKRHVPLFLLATVLILTYPAALAGERPLNVKGKAGSVSAYEITSSASLLGGSYADGQLHDYMLENDRIAVVISRMGHVVHHAVSGGNIIDAGSSTDRIDSLEEFYTYFDDDWPRQADYDSLVIVNDGSSGGPAMIRVTGVDSDNPSIDAVTEYSLAVDGDSVVITTTLTKRGGGTVSNLELGDAFAWGECRKFAPGHGFDLDGMTTTGLWIAGTASAVSYGYVSHHGDIWGPHGNYWSDLNVKTVTLGPGDSASYTRNLVVGGSDIASVATLIHHIQGIPVGAVDCSVNGRRRGEPIDAPAAGSGNPGGGSQGTNPGNVFVVDTETGDPLPGALIDVHDGAQIIYAQMETDGAGKAGVTLPPGDWKLDASAPGSHPLIAWLTVEAGSTESCVFVLVPDGAIPPAGDTLTVIQRPLVNIPALVAPGDAFVIECDADPATTGWAATLTRGGIEIPLTVLTAQYDPATLWWRVSCRVPQVPLYELYDLSITADGGIEDVSGSAVRVIPGFKEDYYFIHITDTHLPTHMYHTEPGSENDISEVVDLREVIADIDIINPEFVLLTGDLVNEGEMEDYLYWRVYTRAQALLGEFPVPVFLTAGNHDIGGWQATPPPDGTARRDWWRFFGWQRLDDPPAGAPWYTQNYSFDYGPVHFVGLEAYNNYDGWRSGVYGDDSFTSGQMQWLAADLAAASGSAARVLFYHCDFQDQLNLGALGVDMALWGHIHKDGGSLYSQPYDLATAETNNLCDGKRSYRLIRVSNGALYPTATLSAGSSGGNLRVEFTPANNGNHDEVTAEVTNDHGQGFEHGMLKFVMPKGYVSADVTGGSLYQVDDSDGLDIYYVSVNIGPSSSRTVILSLSL